MYKMSRNPENIVVPAQNTRQNQKIVFHFETKIGTKYASSPFYKGSKLWNELSKSEQEMDNIYDFKTCIKKKNATFIRDYYV